MGVKEGRGGRVGGREGGREGRKEGWKEGGGSDYMVWLGL